MDQPRVLPVSPPAAADDAAARSRMDVGHLLCYLWLMAWEALALGTAVLLLLAPVDVLIDLGAKLHLPFVRGNAIGFGYVVCGFVLFFTSSVYYLLEKPGLARIAQYTSLAMLLVPVFVTVLGGFLLHVLGGAAGLVKMMLGLE